MEFRKATFDTTQLAIRRTIYQKSVNTKTQGTEYPLALQQHVEADIRHKDTLPSKVQTDDLTTEVTTDELKGTECFRVDPIVFADLIMAWRELAKSNFG